MIDVEQLIEGVRDLIRDGTVELAFPLDPTADQTIVLRVRSAEYKFDYNLSREALQERKDDLRSVGRGLVEMVIAHNREPGDPGYR